MMNKQINQEWINILTEGFTAQQKEGFVDCSDPKNETIKDLLSIQEKHFKLFLEKGLPDVQDSQWKFTHQKKWLKHLFYPAKTASDPIPLSSSFSLFTKDIKKNSAYNIHFHNGRLIKGFDESIKSPSAKKNNPLPKDIQFCEWSDISPDFPEYESFKKLLNREGDGLYHLSGAFSSNGFILYIPDKVEIKKPIHIHFSFDNPMKQASIWNMRNFIFLGENANLNLIESISASKNILANTVTDINCANHSQLSRLQIDNSSAESVLINQSLCELHEQAHLDQLNISLGEGFSRDATQVNQLGEKAHSVLLHLYLLKEKAERDQRFTINHLKPAGYSSQFSRGVLKDSAKHLFHGKTFIASQAEQTDCNQSAKNLSLSSRAESFIYPELDIHCGNVKAQHGATVGDLNTDELFYLQSRGLDEQSARQFLIYGYIQAVLNQFRETDMIEQLNLNKNILDNFSL